MATRILNRHDFEAITFLGTPMVESYVDQKADWICVDELITALQHIKTLTELERTIAIELILEELK